MDDDSNDSPNDSTTESVLYSFVNELDLPDKLGNTSLHNAVLQNDEEMLKYILQQKNVDLNTRNENGYTALNLSIAKMRSESFIMHLIKAGSDINIGNSYKVTSLHDAVMIGQMNNIVHELIKGGANINAQDEDGSTPLHYAVKDDNVEALCMLLYYGADVNMLDEEKDTPFMYALLDSKINTARILFDYYDNFDNKSEEGYTVLHLASLCDSTLTIKMIEAGADVNCITSDGFHMLEFTLLQNDVQAFKCAWPKLDYQSLLKCFLPFLFSYVRFGHYDVNDWVECIYLVLSCPVALELMERCNKFVYKINRKCSFFHELLSNFNTLQVQTEDRIKIVSICLTLGAEVYGIFDLNVAVNFYGIGRELEILMYALDSYTQLYSSNDTMHPILPYFLAMQDFETETFFKLCLKQCVNIFEQQRVSKIANNVINSLGFFSLSACSKLELINWYESYLKINCYELRRKLVVVPEIPSLQELSRNQLYNLIRKGGKIKKPYQFHDAVKSLKLPRSLQDIICFKTPLYG